MTAPEPPAPCRLAFDLAADAVDRLLKAPVLAGLRDGRVRSGSLEIVWHDTAGGEFAAHHLSLGAHRESGEEMWRLEALTPALGEGPLWLPAHMPPVLAQAESLAAFNALFPHRLAAHLAPVAAFSGRRRRYALEMAGQKLELSLLEGNLRGVAQDLPTQLVMLTGPTAQVTQLAEQLAQSVALAVPRAGLAAQAIAMARARPVEARHLGAPVLPAGADMAEALQSSTAQLADVILYWAAQIPHSAATEPVHQMRVGVRRLRSVLAAFRRALLDETGKCGWLDWFSGRLRGLAAQLGAARDWDVFLGETADAVRAAVGPEPRLEALLAAAERKRAASYAALRAYLAGPDFAALSLDLALLPTRAPWGGTPLPELRAYAEQALARRLKHVLLPGPDLTGLPVEQLHETRKQAKRLRYATELFAPLFAAKAVKRYVPHLEDLQAALGSVNDASVAQALLAQLGGDAARHYAPHNFAAGLVLGFGAAGQQRAIRRVDRIWEKFYRATPFWD